MSLHPTTKANLRMLYECVVLQEKKWSFNFNFNKLMPKALVNIAKDLSHLKRLARAKSVDEAVNIFIDFLKQHFNLDEKQVQEALDKTKTAVEKEIEKNNPSLASKAKDFVRTIAKYIALALVFAAIVGILRKLKDQIQNRPQESVIYDWLTDEALFEASLMEVSANKKNAFANMYEAYKTLVEIQNKASNEAQKRAAQILVTVILIALGAFVSFLALKPILLATMKFDQMVKRDKYRSLDEFKADVCKALDKNQLPPGYLTKAVVVIVNIIWAVFKLQSALMKSSITYIKEKICNDNKGGDNGGDNTRSVFISY